jgi:hypothetical protein
LLFSFAPSSAFSLPPSTTYSYTFTDEDLKWFKQAGCEETKVESEPGDLILVRPFLFSLFFPPSLTLTVLPRLQWDSRTIHWNRTPVADQVRVVVYVCYAPKAMASEEVLAIRKDCFERRLATTHWSVLLPLLSLLRLILDFRFLPPRHWRLLSTKRLFLTVLIFLSVRFPRRPAPHITVPLTEYGPAMRGDQPDPMNRDRPFVEPVVTEKMLELVGY